MLEGTGYRPHQGRAVMICQIKFLFMALLPDVLVSPY